MGIIKWRAVPLRTAEEADLLTFVRTKLAFEPDEFQKQVLGERHHRLILNCTRQWGKSTVIAAAALHRALMEPNSLIIVAGPSERQSGEFMRKVRQFVRMAGLPVKKDGGVDFSVVLPNGSRVIGLPENPDNVRGFSGASLVIIDEAARVSDEMYRTLRPMLASTNGDLWMMSTPCGKRGFFYHTWTNGGDQWKRITVTAMDCERISKEFLKEERETMTEYWFNQEYMCVFSDVESSLFDRDVILSCFSKDIQPLDL